MLRPFRGRAALLGRSALAATLAIGPTLAPFTLALAHDGQGGDRDTATPIKHVIVIVGENRTFDHLFATYTSPSGDYVHNLLAEGVIQKDGSPGPAFSRGTQKTADDTATYMISPPHTGEYSPLPPPRTGGTAETTAGAHTLANGAPPYEFVSDVVAEQSVLRSGLATKYDYLLTTGASGLPGGAVDTRITDASNLPNGPFEITGPTMAYDTYAASPVHRFYQMWQQTDCAAKHIATYNPSGCLNDLFAWVELTVGAGSNGAPPPSGGYQTHEGATALGFYNMAQGDAPYTRQLADRYTISDNYHQPIMGGTGANSLILGYGFPIYWSDSNGSPAKPPSGYIENPNPHAGANNFYLNDGYGSAVTGDGGSLTDCSDPTQPGIKPILDYLGALAYHPASRCAAGAFYLVNNYNPGYLGDGTVNTAAFTLPPSKVRHIGDVMNEHHVSWAYYGAGWNNFVKIPKQPAGQVYCNICDPFLYSTQTMTDPKQRTEHLKDITDFEADVAKGWLPAVSYIKPDGLLDGHPTSSKWNLFEAFVQRVINEVKSDRKLWSETAILITTDEGGGYWDSGYIQPLDFFGDGTRIPAIMVSPYSRGGRVSHTYADHASFLKFVEYNWHLPPITSTGRDALPNPKVDAAYPYFPTNSPAIGDLTDMFDFNQGIWH